MWQNGQNVLGLNKVAAFVLHYKYHEHYNYLNKPHLHTKLQTLNTAGCVLGLHIFRRAREEIYRVYGTNMV